MRSGLQHEAGADGFLIGPRNANQKPMDLAKRIRLNRIFSHPSQRLCSVAVDHFVGYQKGLPEGLVNVPDTIRRLVAGRPDAITMLKGMAKSAWEPFAGRVPLIIQAVTFTADDAVSDIRSDSLNATGRERELTRLVGVLKSLPDNS